MPLLAWLVIAATTGITGSARSLGERTVFVPRACVNVIENGDFERGVDSLSPWASKGFAVVSDQRVHSGSLAFWMGGYRDADDSLFQWVVIPEAQSVTLSYWLNMHSLEDEGAVHDFLIASVRSASGSVMRIVATQDNTGPRDTWEQITVDLSEFAGMGLELHMSCQGDGEDVTSFFIDDVELQACGDMATPTATPSPTSRRFLPLVWHEAS